ncbi:MAG: hypothetical protein ACM3U2_22770 [Deltaproteobacteria bacterium]
MATTTEAPRPEAKHYVDYEEYVDFQLEKTRSSIKLTDIFTTLTALAVAVIGYLLVFVVFDQWVLEGGFGYAARVSLLCVLLAGVLGTLTWRVFLPLIRRIHPLYAARVIEKSDPNLKSNLVNFVDVRQSNAQSAPVVLRAMEKRAAVELSHIDVEEAVDRRPLLRIAYALLAVVVVCALYIIFSPKDPFASVRRALLPTAAIEVATETTITEVVPEDMKVPARTILTVTAEIRGKDADTAQILFTTADHKYVNYPVEMKRDEPTLPRFSGVLNGENGRGLLQSLTYRIVAGDARSREYTITVIQPPSARIDEVQYEFPKYMELENRKSAEGHIDGWEGAAVTVKATANVPVKSARIVLTDTEDPQAKGEEISMFVSDGTNLSATWKLEFRSDGTAPRYYHVAVTTEKRETDPDPTQYTLRIRPDQRPEVALLAPTSDLEMPANGVVPLIIQAADPDFQLRSIALKAERNGESILDKRLFDDRFPSPTISGKYDFPLAPLKLTEGETIQFWIEAKDNKQPTANRTTTPRINVHIGKPASAKEVEQQLAEEKKKQDQLAQAGDQQNPERPDASPPAESGDETKPEKPRPREPGEPRERRKPNDQQPDNEPDAAPGQPQKDDRRPGEKNRPDTIQEALQKLLQKEQEEEQRPGDEQQKQEQPQQQPEEGKNAAEKGSKQPGAGQRQQNGEKSPESNPKNSNQNNGGKQSDAAAGRERPKPGDRTPGKDEKPGQDPRTKSEKNDPQQSKAGKNDREKTQPKGGKQTGDNRGGAGQADDENPSNKPDGQQPDKSPKTADPKSAAGEKKDGAGEKNAGQQKPVEQNPEKADDGKHPAAGKQPGDKDQPADDEPEKSAKKDGTKTGARNDDTASSNPDSKDQGKRDPGKKDDAEKPGDQGDKTDQADGKNKPSKPDQAGGDAQKPGAEDKPSTEQKNSPQGGAGKDDSKPSDPAGNPKDASKGKGSKSNSDMPAGDPQGGDEGGRKTKRTDDEKGRQARDAAENGEEKPADDSPDAVKKKADGTEAGEATGDQDGDPQAPKAGDKVMKKPGSEPGAKKKSQGDSDPEVKKTGDKRPPEEGSSGSSADPDKAKRAPDGKDPTDRPGKLDDPQSPDRPDLKKNRDPEKRPGQPPDGGNRDLKGEGSKNQQSKQSDAGENGGGQTADQGKRGANQTGPGDQSDEAGATDSAKKITGKSGSKKGEGSKTQPTDEKGERDTSPGNERGKEPSSKKSQGKSSDQPGKSGDESGEPGSQDSKGETGKPGSAKSGGKSGKSGKDGAGNQSGTNPDARKSDGQGSQPGKPGNSGNSSRGAGIQSRPGEGDEPGEGNGGPSDGKNPKPRDVSGDDEPPTPEEDEANLEHARKATNLVLTRLKEQLDRGEVDQKLLEELGWKDRKDLDRLVKFLDQGLNNRDDDNSPDALARKQQFEEVLKSLRLGNETGSRSGGAGTTRRIHALDTRNVPVPPEYRRLYESYTRSLSKNPDPAAKKK